MGGHNEIQGRLDAVFRRVTRNLIVMHGVLPQLAVSGGLEVFAGPALSGRICQVVNFQV